MGSKWFCACTIYKHDPSPPSYSLRTTHTNLTLLSINPPLHHIIVMSSSDVIDPTPGTLCGIKKNVEIRIRAGAQPLQGSDDVGYTILAPHRIDIGEPGWELVDTGMSITIPEGMCVHVLNLSKSSRNIAVQQQLLLPGDNQPLTLHLIGRNMRTTHTSYYNGRSRPSPIAKTHTLAQLVVTHMAPHNLVYKECTTGDDFDGVNVN